MTSQSWPAALPPLLVLTDRHAAAARGHGLAQAVGAAVEGGARAVVLREKDLSWSERTRLTERLQAVLAQVGGVLIVASGPLLGAGVHLAASDPWTPAPLVGRSCHDAAGLVRAAREGCSYATVSPVQPSSSKPGYGPPLGFDGLAALTRVAAPLPVYALGGLNASRAAACRSAGAAGVAVMGGVMGAADPAAEVAALLAAWHDMPVAAP